MPKNGIATSRRIRRGRYAPALSPLVLKALHYEARRRSIPMTRLADACLTEVLQESPGWLQAEREYAAETLRASTASTASEAPT